MGDTNSEEDIGNDIRKQLNCQLGLQLGQRWPN
jgi:hypothetical protein